MFSTDSPSGYGIFKKSPEEAEVNAKLEALRADNWQALRDMPPDELNSIVDDIKRTPHYGAFDDYFSTLRAEAGRAVNDEKVKRNIARSEHEREQQRRKANISRAANLAASVVECLSIAVSIERDSPSIPSPSELPNMGAMAGDELTSLVSSNRAEALNLENWKAHIESDAAKLRPLKVDVARRIIKELEADAAALAETIASMGMAADMAETELDRRKAERERIESERAEVEENLPAIVAELRAEIEALKGQGNGSAD